MRGSERRLLLAGLALLGLTLGGLALGLDAPDKLGMASLGTAPLVTASLGTASLGTGWRADGFIALLAVAGAIYLGTCAMILRMPAAAAPSGRGSRGLAIVLIFAALLRLGPLLAPPFLSSDVYRYVWDGRVGAAGINPYRYIPDDAHLAFLRDRAIFPHINRASYAHTIYPPTAQVVFRAVAAAGGGMRAMKGAMVAAECIAIAALLALLARAGLPAERIALYAWNPLAIWAFAGNGHVDALAIGLLALALLAVARGRQGLGGALGGAAFAVKFLPALMLPPLWRARRIRFAIAATLIVALLYLPYLDIGWRVLGFLGGYAREEGLRSGTGLWPLDVLGALVHGVSGAKLPAIAPKLYLAGIAILLGAAGLGIARAKLPADPAAAITTMARGMACLGLFGMLAISPHYDWYFAWLALPAVLAPSPALLFLSVAPVLLYLDPWQERLIWPALVYGPAWVLAIRDWRHARLPRWRIASAIPSATPDIARRDR